MNFHSILFPAPCETAVAERERAPDFFYDLHLDQVVRAVTAEWQEYNLPPFYFAPLHSLDTIAYRQEVFQDLENPQTLLAIRTFSQSLRNMREKLLQGEKLAHYTRTQQRCFLAAVQLYSEAIDSLSRTLLAISPKSRGLHAFCDYLREYVASTEFRDLAKETISLHDALRVVRYSILIRNGSVTIRNTDGGDDCSVAVESTFQKFRNVNTGNYLLETKKWEGLNHIEAQIQDRVALLYPTTFAALDCLCTPRKSAAKTTGARSEQSARLWQSTYTTCPNSSFSFSITTILALNYPTCEFGLSSVLCLSRSELVDRR
jgi:DNA mismatch repair protein MutS